jgi:V8-like Glu-specific endopeptidase
MLAFTAYGCVCVEQAAAQTVRNVNGFTVLTQSATGQQTSIDFVNAKPMPLPVDFVAADQTQYLVSALLSPTSSGTPGYVRGAEGSGTLNPVFLGKPELTNGGIGLQQFGTNNHPFSTARADLNAGGVTATNKMYPYSPAGKLFFRIGTSSYICSASMIKRGIAVTAAHCVANYGRSQFYSGWQFVPGYRGGNAPYGVATVYQAWIKTAYYNGTDGCYQYGVICPDDVAVLILAPAPTSDPPRAGLGMAGTASVSRAARRKSPSLGIRPD